jgi:glycosyltransferase involved in cell wall biosynthesis
MAKKHSLWIFVISVCASLMLLAFERQIGIGWDYHPDAVTYVRTYSNVIANIINSGGRDLLTQLYFVFSWLLNGNIAALIGINIVVYSITSCMIYEQLKGFITSRVGLICVLLIIFMPYRMHLAVHVLKDTFLIAFLAGSILGIRFLILPAILISVRSIFYFPSVMRYRGAILCFVGFAISLIAFDEFRGWVQAMASNDFRFRAYDTVPTFVEISNGSIIRAVIWPVLFLTGGFIFLSPGMLMLPLAFGQLIAQFAVFGVFKRPILSFGLFISIAFMAYISPGFTTFFRYSTPIFVLFPLILAQWARAGKKGEKLKAVFAFIGSNGIPNKYGGFESFLEAICPEMVKRGFKVIVTCDPSKYSEREPRFEGVDREFVPIKANGFRSTLHDLAAFFKVFLKADVVVVLGVSAGPFFLLFRMFCWASGKSLVVNIDGIEWRRTKFSKPIRFILWAYDLFAQISANVIIYDNKELLSFVKPMFRSKAKLIAYSADHVLRNPSVILEQKTALTICRIEPENNIELLILGALASGIEKYTFIGNWNNSLFGKTLKAKYANEPQLQLLDPIYDLDLLVNYREACAFYLHGHSVGGSNPSLIEMLSYGCHILCYDCGFNRETTGVDAQYFSSPEDLARLIDLNLAKSPSGGRAIQKRYTKKYIADEFIQLGDGVGL